jgi:predicted RNA-binding Zn-ribbon protein involved in translation (DUF1610 family)
MFDGDGAETLELQAWKIAQNQLNYRGSTPCPTCGVILNPVEAMYSLLCPPCKEDRAARRVKRKMA